MISRTWLTRNSAAWVMPQIARARPKPYTVWIAGTTAIMPTIIRAQKAAEAFNGCRSTARPPRLLPIRPTAPKPIRHQPTSAPSKPARRSSMSAR
ncbi:hypothetical protein D3C79_852070 [compost metagenome]